MGVSTIAFLILLGGTAAEHIIEMSSYDDCRRAAETISQFECLSADEFDARLKETNRIETDMLPASGHSTPPRPTVDPVQTESAISGMPSAVQRQIRDALYPPAEKQLTPRDDGGE